MKLAYRLFRSFRLGILLIDIFQHDKLQESRGEKQSAKEQKQRILEMIPETEDESPEFGDDKSEMSEDAVKSSPVWRFFKPDPDSENQVRCLACNKVS